MFLSLLSESQKLAFARVARYIIAADEVVDENEQWFMHLALHEMTLEEWPPRPGTEDQLRDELKAFDNPVSKNILLLESLCVALADGDLDPRERYVIELLVEDRNIRHDRMEEFEGAAREYLALVNRGEALITLR
jgi:hypothetical protein